MKNVIITLVFISNILSAYCQTREKQNIVVTMDKVMYGKPIINFGKDFYEKNPLRQLKVGEVKLDKKLSFLLAIDDVNQNQLYNDVEDVLYIAKHDVDSIPLGIKMNYTRNKDNAIINFENNFFMIKKVDLEGNFIILETISKSDDYDLKLFQDLVLPNLNFKLINGNTVNFHEFLNKKDLIYIEVWGMWCAPCLDATEELKSIYKIYGKNLEIISLNERDNPSEVLKYIREKNIKWINGFTSDKINKELLQNAYPYGILFDKTGKLIVKMLHPMLLRNYLDNYFNE